MQSILPNLFRAVSSLAGSQHPVNSYVLVRDGKAVLIDPAADVTPDRLDEIGGPRVERILITHLQAEHADGCANFPDVPVHIAEDDAYLAHGPEAYRKVLTRWQEPWEWETRGNFKGHLGGAPNERPPARPLNLGQPLQPGAALAGFDVVSTPGHGKHAMTFIMTVDGKRVAFCGDLMHADGKLWNWFDCDWDYGLHGGQKALRASLDVISKLGVDLLCPAHGPVIAEPGKAIDLLKARLEAVLNPPQKHDPRPINFDEVDSPVSGFRQLLPNLHQYRAGNCAVLVSQTREAMLVDDGLCHWTPLPDRREHHRQTMCQLKQALGVDRITLLVPTHYHGDHVENIPALVAMENTRIVSLDVVAEVLLEPDRFGLACPLPWYDAGSDTVPVHQQVRSGQRIRWNEFELEMFHLGGQTYYHAGIAVTVGGRRVLFVGDAIGGQGVSVDPVLTYNDAEPATRGWAYALDRMIERKPDLLVCGHGSAMIDPMETLLARRRAWDPQIAAFAQLNAREDPMVFFSPFV